MDAGVLNLNAADMITLGGNILNEREDTYIVGGRIEKNIPMPTAGKHINTGMGMSFTSSSVYPSLSIVRGHERYQHRGEESIAKYYEFTTPIMFTDIDFSYLDVYATKPTNEYLLYRQTQNEWESVTSTTNASTKHVVAKLSPALPITLFTLFPYPNVTYTKLLTPNGDGINDYFEVTSIEKYPDNKFVVILSSGKIVYEKAQYNNDFDGSELSLSEGTYYFMFFGNKDDDKPLIKGFFELLRNNTRE
jgi:gliding motility-associated-like protein